jgi:S-adenosylmethionine decarboxylase
MHENAAPCQLGVELDDNPAPALRDVGTGENGSYSGQLPAPDYFVERDGRRYAGVHLIVDVWGGEALDDLDHIDAALREAAARAGATLLHLHLHHFGEGGGVSGVAVLAESHISIHTWPERDYAAFDIFMCGATEPEAAVQVIRERFAPRRVEVSELLRGPQE